MDGWLVLGAAVYWASVGFRYLGFFSESAAPLDPWASMGKYAVLVVVIALAYLAMRAVGVLRARRFFSSVALVVSVALGAMTLMGGVCPPPVLVPLDFLVIGSSMVLWGLAFASFDKRRAAQNVIVAALLAVLVMVVGFGLSPWVPLDLLSYAYFALSAAVLLFGPIPCASHARTLVANQRSHQAFSIVERLIFGLALGFCSEASQFVGPFGPAGPLVVFAVVCLLVSAALALRASDYLQAFLPVLLLVAVGALFLPFFEGGVASATWAAPCVIWLAWSSFSAVQLSDLKERYGMSELDVCLADKLLLTLGFFAGGALWALGAPILGDAIAGHPMQLGVFAVVLTLVLSSAYATARLVGERSEDAVRDELARTREERLEEAYERLSQEVGLSKRECEVMKMLAKGYTSVYICEELGFSTGTAKAHTAHIYQKLGIHRKDELLELVEKRVSEV